MYTDKELVNLLENKATRLFSYTRSIRLNFDTRSDVQKTLYSLSAFLVHYMILVCVFKNDEDETAIVFDRIFISDQEIKIVQIASEQLEVILSFII